MMFTLVRMLVGIALLCGLVGAPAASMAQGNQLVPVTSGVQYQLLARWDVERLNQILQIEIPKFSEISVAYSPARGINDPIESYRVAWVFLRFQKPPAQRFQSSRTSTGQFTKGNRFPLFRSSPPKPNS